MARFPEIFLDEIRARLKPSVVVGRHMKLRRAGSEYVAVDDKSFTVNDVKGIIHDFGKTGFDGDIIAYEQWRTGCTFVVAVEELARLAGIPLPDEGGRRPSRGGNGARPPADQDGDPGPAPRDDLQHGLSTRAVSSTWDYEDRDGALAYQEAKVEWSEDGERKKVVLPRRRVPGVEGWVWGLKAGEYLRARNGDWYVANEKRRERWKGAPRQLFDETPPELYRLPELLEEAAEPPEERRLVWLPEGAKDADTIAAWGLLATTSSGGTSGWRPHFAEHLRGFDVVIPIDNDMAGRKFGHLKANGLRGIARSVRLLDFRDHWAACPEKGDVTDWRDLGGGTREKLFAILDRLPPWAPTPPDSQFGAVRWLDLDRPARELEWLIKRMVTRGEVSIWFGPPGCGKSFLITDAALAIARGVSWFGERVRPGLVIYQAGEGGLGLKKRLRAYRRHHGLRHDDDVPFVLLPTRINLWKDDADVDKLIAEIKEWAAFYDVPLELVVIDTLSAASTGANENASEDVGRVLQRCHRIAVETGAHVALVHHTPKAGGSPRGWSGLTGNVESAIEIIHDEETVEQDGVRRNLREFVTRKQKDGEANITWQFVLRQVVLGSDADGDPDTSCVVERVLGAGAAARAASSAAPAGYVELKGNNLVLMRALVAALAGSGVVDPAGARAPSLTRCVRVSDWKESLYSIAFVDTVNDPDGKRGRDRARKAVDRAFTQQWDWVDKARLVGKNGDWVWRTTRRVAGVDPPPAIAAAMRGDAPAEDEVPDDEKLPF